MRLFEVPEPVPPSEHWFKYSLSYGRQGEKIVGYDNERGKDDHRHLGKKEELYRFRSVEDLIMDFLRDVAAEREGNDG